MTSNSGKKRNTSNTRTRSTSNNKNVKRTTRSQTGNKRSTKANTKRQTPIEEESEFDYVKTLIFIGVFAVFIIMFVFSLNIFDGGFALFFKGVFRGLFGINAFVIPIVGILCVIYYIATPMTKKKFFDYLFIAASLFAIGSWAHLYAFDDISSSKYSEMIPLFYHNQNGGGLIFGTVAYVIDHTCGRALIWILALIVLLASIAFIFGKFIVSFISFLIERFNNLDSDNEDNEDTVLERKHKEQEIRKLKDKVKADDDKKNKKAHNFKINDESSEETSNEPVNMIIDVNPYDIKAIIPSDDKPSEVKKETNDIHQIKVKEIKTSVTDDDIKPINVSPAEEPKVIKITPVTGNVTNINELPEIEALKEDIEPVVITKESTVSLTDNSKKMLEIDTKEQVDEPVKEQVNTVSSQKENVTKPYVFPSVNLLQKIDVSSKKGDNILEVSEKLRTTLATFGVDVTIDPANCSRGPAVTRYELTPAPGVKVSRIVSLSDDIKLSLGATDIRIEAPIPGKSAVGIEVPNSESTTVPFRDLIESHEFNEAKSKITFAIGKDLSGKTVLADIGKMPHLLIAGATGSGKSICINTIIMSILYKAHPNDVKMILIDPKVVELSVYNGIPHLLLPVVTDPKQASASLHWGVSEMEDRYKKFADAGVRDLKGYNEAAAKDDNIKRLPQIVIIVDELADLMMVAGKEVEESICRLAQLARAAGIHLIIATQRPSVDVITGLIKANMPSRIAFSVSSGIDSRTILDQNGAEKLLGKGDMLFFPQGLTKPSRIQGCFVSDNDVLNVVDFIKNQNISGYDERMADIIKSNNSSVCQVPGGDIDELFGQAGEFIIGKEKASIGALQRAFKIGFNRAARIMDQLEAKGVVGPEEGTKPRKILMNIDEFKDLINTINS